MVLKKRSIVRNLRKNIRRISNTDVVEKNLVEKVVVKKEKVSEKKSNVKVETELTAERVMELFVERVEKMEPKEFIVKDIFTDEEWENMGTIKRGLGKRVSSKVEKNEIKNVVVSGKTSKGQQLYKKN